MTSSASQSSDGATIPNGGLRGEGPLSHLRASPRPADVHHHGVDEPVFQDEQRPGTSSDEITFALRRAVSVPVAPAAPKNEPGAQGKASLATASGGLEARPSQAKFHFCPADALILALGLIVFSLQAHASLHLHSVTKPMMLMICMAVAVVFALAHNLITCRVIRVRAVFARFTVRAVCVLTSFAATLVATILETLYPYGGDTELSSCPGIGTTGDGATSTSSISPSQLCAELQASHILSYFLLSTEAIAAFLIVTHWFNVREMRSDGLPLSLGELLRMTEKEVDQALETLRIGGQLRDSETKRRALATRLDFISEYSV